jgi:hypothetical protein
LKASSLLIKDPVADGPCVFTGKAAIYYGKETFFDNNGHTLLKNQPLAVCDKTAAAIARIESDIFISESTYHYNGGGCC